MSYSSKKFQNLQKDIKYINPLVHQKLKSIKILRNAMNNNSTLNSKKNISFTKTKNNEDTHITIYAEKCNNCSNIFFNKNYSFHSFSLKNKIQKNKMSMI